MNVHFMKLKPDPFRLMLSGEKTIEMRLYDEKRRKVCVGDRIFFENVSSGETLETKVLKLHRFSSFDELYRALPLWKCGYALDCISEAKASDMEHFYSVESQKKYGVIGIELAVIPEGE